MKRIIVLIIGVVISVSANARDKCDKDINVFIDIDGIEIGTFPTKDELNNHFGVPISDELLKGDVGDYYLVEYDGLKIYLDENRRLCGFELVSNQYPIMTLYGRDNGIKIGDSWSKFLNAGFPIYAIDEKNDNGKMEYVVYLWYKSNVSDHFTVFKVVDDTITYVLSDDVDW